jgi:exosortase
MPPLAIYLTWTRRGALGGISAVADWRGVLITTVACFLFIVGVLGAEAFLMRISFVVLLTGLIVSVAGFETLRILFLPLVLLAAMIPPPGIIYSSITLKLQLFSATFAADILDRIGVTVYRSGNIIHLGGITLGVAEACNGISSLSALVVGGAVLGSMARLSWTFRAVLCIVAVPISIFVNSLRIAITAVLAEANPVLAGGVYHATSGWLIFLVGFALLLAFANLLTRVATRVQL